MALRLSAPSNHCDQAVSRGDFDVTSGNRAASIRARLLNESRRRNEQFEYALVRYASERFLYRLSKSPYRDQFIIKGATLFACWTGALHRPTRDLDFLAFGDPAAAQMFRVFGEISAQEVEDDGLRF